MDNSPAARRILGHLQVFLPVLRDPSHAVPIRRLALESGTPYATTWRVVREAAGLGLVRLTRVGATVQVAANPSSPLFDTLRDIGGMSLDPFLKAAERFIQRARQVPDVERIVLFGSAGQGEARPGSDVDLAVILRGRRSTSVDRIRRMAADVSDEMGIPVVPVATTSKEVSRRGQFPDAVRAGRELYARNRRGRGLAGGR